MYSIKEINEINEEIKKNGNTNLITDSMLESQIFAVGDSHTIFFYNSLKIKEHYSFISTLPLTMYKFINMDIDIYNIGTILGNKHEKYNIKENDYVIFYFGYNDVQRNIDIHAKNKWKEEINELCRKYLNKIIDIKNIYKINPIIPCIYPNPLPNAKGQNPSGSYCERRQYTIYMNEVLSTLCSIYYIPFLDIYDLITDEDGYIKSKLTKDSIHLNHHDYELKKLIEDKIYELIDLKIIL